MTTINGAERQMSSSGMEGAVTDIGLDSYATAWRYLGVYTDCGGTGGWGSGVWSSWWGGGNDDGDDDYNDDYNDDDGSSSVQCSGGTRKLLWAAVRFCLSRFARARAQAV